MTSKQNKILIAMLDAEDRTAVGKADISRVARMFTGVRIMVSLRFSVSLTYAVDIRAKKLGVSRTDYIEALIRLDLASRKPTAAPAAAPSIDTPSLFD